jgi:hypothetical protein
MIFIRRRLDESRACVHHFFRKHMVHLIDFPAEERRSREGIRDKLYKELELMKEQIVGKCLGLPVAIVQAAKGFALLEHKPHVPPMKMEDKALADETVPGKTEPAAQATAEANQPAN